MYTNPIHIVLCMHFYSHSYPHLNINIKQLAIIHCIIVSCEMSLCQKIV